MTTETLLLYLGLAVFGLMLSALFSGVETGLYTLNRVRLRVRAAQGERNAVRLQNELRQPGRILVTLLLGNNIANYLGSYGVAKILDGFGIDDVQAIIINAGILIPALFVFGETLPKDLFRTNTDRWSYALSAWLTGCRRLLTWVGLNPLVSAFGSLLTGRRVAAALPPRQRIGQLIKEGVGAGVLSEAQTTLADRVLALRDRTLRSEMVPWRDVVKVRRDDRAGLRRALRQHPFTRLPVLDESGAVAGVVSTLEAVMQVDQSLESLMQPALVLEDATPVRDAMRRMRHERRAMAIVTNASGRPVGLVTLKDLVEPLTGELAAW